MSWDTVFEYALMLTTPDPPPQAPAGLPGLSERERGLVILVAHGRTDAQIAAQQCLAVLALSVRCQCFTG